jgi:hypothetical protein
MAVTDNPVAIDQVRRRHRVDVEAARARAGLIGGDHEVRRILGEECFGVVGLFVDIDARAPADRGRRIRAEDY